MNDKISVLRVNNSGKVEKKMSKTQHVGFEIKGLYSYNGIVLVHGEDDCVVIDVNSLGDDVEDVVTGFDGKIRSASLISSEEVGIVSDTGLYIYNIKNSLYFPYFTILWTDNVKCDKVSFDPIQRLVLLVSETGELWKTEVKNISLNSDCMEKVEGPDRIKVDDVSYMEGMKKTVVRNKNGIYCYDPHSKDWDTLFMVSQNYSII